MSGPPEVGPSSGGWAARSAAFLRRHPVLCLLLLTPGIPEYLSGSSSPVVLIVNPLTFVLFLALNAGMYTGGVLLIREARIRWRLGWASVLTLGLAYGIAEEGFALTTLFDPHNPQVIGSPAGPWGGVNWGWTSGILPFHAVFSVALPLYLLDRALPEIRGRSFLTPREVAVTAVVYLGTVASLGTGFALGTYWMGWPVFVGGLAAVAGLIALARALPSDALELPGRAPTGTPTALFLIGASAFPVLLLGPGLVATLHPPIPLLVVVAPALWAGYLAIVVPRLGTRGGEAVGVAFAAGLVSPLIISGLLIGVAKGAIGLPAVGVVDVLAILFLRWLYRKAQGRSMVEAPPYRPLPVGA